MAPGIAAAGIASGTGGEVAAEPGAAVLGIGVFGRDGGTAVPGIAAAATASGASGEVMAARVASAEGATDAGIDAEVGKGTAREPAGASVIPEFS